MPRAEKAAVEYVKNHLTKQGWTVYGKTDVRGKKWIGYDLLAIRDREFRFIEVKGTEKEFSIPDMIETEFTRKLTLIATHLYIVGNLNNPRKTPILYEIPREAFSRRNFTLKKIIHFKRKFDKDFMQKFRTTKLAID